MIVGGTKVCVPANSLCKFYENQIFNETVQGFLCNVKRFFNVFLPLLANRGWWVKGFLPTYRGILNVDFLACCCREERSKMGRLKTVTNIWRSWVVVLLSPLLRRRIGWLGVPLDETIGIFGLYSSNPDFLG